MSRWGASDESSKTICRQAIATRDPIRSSTAQCRPSAEDVRSAAVDRLGETANAEAEEAAARPEALTTLLLRRDVNQT